MSDLIQLRCSKLPLAFKCPGSVRPGKVSVNESHEAADTGTAAHDGARKLVRTGSVDWESVSDLAKKHGVDEKELRVLLALAAKLWEQVKQSFPNASTELELKADLGFGVVLTGHADIVSSLGDLARVPDWKFGRLDSNYREQLLGYCALLLLKYGHLARAEAAVLWVREQEYEPHAMDRAGLYEWLARVQSEIAEWNGEFRPGAHCQYCPRSHECSAANALARRDIEILMNQEPGLLEDAETVRALVRQNPDKAISLLEIARTAQKKAERVIAALKDEVERAGDVVGSDKRLTLQKAERRKLDAWAAFPVLQEVLEDKEMAEVIDISLSKVEELVAKKAGRGNGAKAKRDLEEKLAAAEAVKTYETASLVVRRQAS